MGLRFYFS